MKRIVMLAVAGAAAIAAAISMTVPAGASAGAHPALTGNETMQVLNSSPKFPAPPAPAIAHGVFTASGFLHRAGLVSLIKFRNGSVKLKPSHVTGNSSLNQKTCLYTLTQRGDMSMYGGTGKYAGATGSGTFQMTVLAIAPSKGGKCSLGGLPVAYQTIIRVSLKVRL